MSAVKAAGLRVIAARPVSRRSDRGQGRSYRAAFILPAKGVRNYRLAPTRGRFRRWPETPLIFALGQSPCARLC